MKRGNERLLHTMANREGQNVNISYLHVPASYLGRRSNDVMRTAIPSRVLRAVDIDSPSTSGDKFRYSYLESQLFLICIYGKNSTGQRPVHLSYVTLFRRIYFLVSVRLFITLPRSTFVMDTDDTLVEEQAVDTTVSGHESSQSRELDRRFTLLSICGIAISTGESWVALGGSIVVSIYNLGPPGVIYGLVVTSVFYWFVAASIAELASAMPSSGTVYHWASITAGPRYGRVCGYFAGWWNFLAWIMGAASLTSFMALQTLAMYSTVNSGYTGQNWHVLLSYLGCTWFCSLLVLFGNRLLPFIESVGAFVSTGGFLISILVCAIMPKIHGRQYASNAFVWRDVTNQTGWTSEAFVFCLGTLNAAFAVGAPDIPSHLAEEMPRSAASPDLRKQGLMLTTRTANGFDRPTLNIPRAILVQYIFSLLTGLLYLITIFYAIADLAPLLSSNSIFPLAELYKQATGSSAATVGLLAVALIPATIGTMGAYVIVGRQFWTLARDNATPYSNVFGHLSSKWGNPFNASLISSAMITLMGFIYLGSGRAFNDLAGSFVILSSISYLAAILPNLLSGRSNIKPGEFRMKSSVGYLVNAVACLYLSTFIVIFSFPGILPVTLENMNYSSLIAGGLTIFIGVFWIWGRKEYKGPGYMTWNDYPLNHRDMAAQNSVHGSI